MFYEPTNFVVKKRQILTKEDDDAVVFKYKVPSMLANQSSSVTSIILSSQVNTLLICFSPNHLDVVVVVEVFTNI